MTGEEITAFLRRRLDALQRHDLTAVNALYAESCTVESPLGGRTTGRDAVRRVYEGFYSAFPDAEFSDAEPIIDGDRVAVLTTVKGTHMGALLGLPPSGKPFSLPIVYLLTLRDGLITDELRVYDFTGLLVQLGVLKAKPA